MNILISHGWKDYELLDSGNEMRFERFGPYKTVRPDPQAIWLPSLPITEWNSADVMYQRTAHDKGIWKFKRAIPEKWKMTYKNLSFWARLTSFKHTGVFPEQEVQWEWITQQIQKTQNTQKLRLSDTRTNRSSGSPSILNLFGYTGIASLAAAAAGAQVTHVDASKPSITWARENQMLSGLGDKPIRWILDDAVKFAEREVRRGSTYDGIIMDPPVYGHGPTGQIWKFNESFPNLLQTVGKLLSPNPLFVVVNAYAISSSSLMLHNVLADFLPKGHIEVGELCLEEKFGKRLLSTGMYARWTT